MNAPFLADPDFCILAQEQQKRVLRLYPIVCAYYKRECIMGASQDFADQADMSRGSFLRLAHRMRNLGWRGLVDQRVESRKKLSRSDRQNAGGEKECAGREPSDGLDTRPDDAPTAAAGDAPVGAGSSLSTRADTAPLFDDFEEYWNSLIQRQPAMASAPSAGVRGLTFAALKEAFRDAFEAGRATYNL